MSVTLCFETQAIWSSAVSRCGEGRANSVGPDARHDQCSASARCRTSSHGMPCDSPAKTRRARFFDFSRPGGLDVSRVGIHVVNSGEEFSGDVSALLGREREGFTKKFLFDIAFDDHSDPRPLVTHGFWSDDYHPLRKDAPRVDFTDDGQPFTFMPVGGEGVYEIHRSSTGPRSPTRSMATSSPTSRYASSSRQVKTSECL